MTTKKEILVDNEHVESMFSNELSPFLRYGSAWLFLLGFSLLTASYFVKWPDTAKAPATLTTSKSPYAIVPKAQGELASLFFANGDSITAGATIGLIENAASSKDIALLEELIQQVDTLYQTQVEDVQYINIQHFTLAHLGEVQPAFEQFLRSYHELKFALSDVFLSKKLELFAERTKSLNTLGQNLKSQEEIIYQDYRISLSKYEQEKMLLAKGSLPAYEFKVTESTMLNKKVTWENIKNSIILNKRSIQDIDEQRLQLLQSIESQKNTFIQNFKNLKFSFLQWKNKYVLISPSNGVVSIANQIQPGYVVSSQKPIAFVLPPRAKPLFQLELPQYNLGEIDTSITVRINLTSYPYEDHGYLEGKIQSIALVPNNGAYETTVGLTNGLTTTMGKKIQFLYGLEGEAELVLEEDRLIQKLFKKFKVDDRKSPVSEGVANQ